MDAIINYFTANNCAELIGTISTLILIVTYSVRGERKIRTMSIIGSCFSIAYNYLMHSTCFLILSSTIVLINLCYLIFFKPE